MSNCPLINLFQPASDMQAGVLGQSVRHVCQQLSGDGRSDAAFPLNEQLKYSMAELIRRTEARAAF